MWVHDYDEPSVWVDRWEARPYDTAEDQAARIEEALEVEARLVPFGPQRWCLEFDVVLLSNFSLEAEHSEIEYLRITCYPKGHYEYSGGRFRENDIIALNSCSVGENSRGDVLRVYERFTGPTAIEDAALFISKIPRREEVALEGYYEVTAAKE